MHKKFITFRKAVGSLILTETYFVASEDLQTGFVENWLRLRHHPIKSVQREIFNKEKYQ